jgi:nicotinamide-nucleotide amidase
MYAAAEIVSIGGELLTGSTLNTNARFISEKLEAIGFTITRQTTVGDHHDLIVETLSESLASVPLVIATGGLGPTLDDITKAAASELFDSPLEYNEEIARDLKKRYQNLTSLENQATAPKKAMILPNKLGTASGLVLHNGQSTLILLPGVPPEMEALMIEEVIPFLQKTFTLPSAKQEAVLHFAGMTESMADPLLRELKTRFSSLKIGIYPSNGLVTIRIEGESHLLHHAAQEIDRDFGEFRFESSDGTIESAIQELFIQKKLTLSLAESCSGGNLSSRLVHKPGASRYFLGSVVAYSNNLKEKILGVPKEVIEKYGAVSKETALAMAEGIQAITGSDFTISVTGIAGPAGGTEEKPVGTIFIAIKHAGSRAESQHIHAASGSRAMIIERAGHLAFGELYKKIKRV